MSNTLESANLAEVWAESRSIVELQQRAKCELGHSSRMLRLSMRQAAFRPDLTSAVDGLGRLTAESNPEADLYALAPLPHMSGCS